MAAVVLVERSRSIDALYLTLCEYLLRAPKVRGTRELNNIKIELADINDNIVSVRGISPSYLFGEWLWYFTGRNDVKFISAFGSMWEQLSDDGTTNNSAYGYLMKKAFGFDQIEKVIELLRKDPDSRRAVVNINTPNKRVIETRDEPCTIALQFLLRDGKLHCTGMMRSNDIWLGFPYDVAFFTELQKYIADELGVNYGAYTHFVVSMHLYDRNYPNVEKIVRNPVSKPIAFDRKKFHEKKDFIADLVEISAKNCSPEFTKTFMTDLAEKYFEYKEVE